MKKFYLFMVLMLTAVTSAFAQGEVMKPEFTAEGTPDAEAHWYYIQFRNSKWVVSIEEDIELAKIKDFTDDEAINTRRQFKFVGTEDNFRIFNKAGNPLVFVPNRGMWIGRAEDSRGNPVINNCELYTDGTHLEIRPKNNVAIDGKTNWTGLEKAMNQFQDKELSCWNKDDRGNQIDFIPVAKQADYIFTERDPDIYPEYNAEGNVWYKIIFSRDHRMNRGKAWQDMGEDAIIETKDINIDRNEEGNNQLWQLVGADKSNFKIVSKSGLYVFYNGQRLSLTSDATQAASFSIEDFDKDTDGVYPHRVQVRMVGNNFVNWYNGRDCGLYHVDGDQGNGIYFDKVKFPEELLPVTVTATGKGTAANVNLEGLTDGKVVKGGTVKLTAQAGASDFFAIKDIKVNGTHLDGDYLLKKSFKTDLTIDENTNIEVEFFQPPVIVVKGVDNNTDLENATVELSNTAPLALLGPTGYIAYPNKEITITATPDEGYEIKSINIKWLENGVEQTKDITATQTFTVKEGVSDPNAQAPEMYGVLVEVVKKAAETHEYKMVIYPDLNAGTVTFEGYTGVYGQGESMGFHYITAQLEKGKEYNVNVVANEGYQFDTLKDVQGNPLSGNKVIAGEDPFILGGAVFTEKAAPAETVAVKIAPTGMISGIPVMTLTDEAGNVLGDPNKELQVAKGSKVTLNIDVKNFIKSIKVGEAELEGKDSYLLEHKFTKEITIEEATTVTVEVFNAAVITVAKTENGTAELTNTKTVGGLVCAIPGEEVKVVAKPADGFVVKSITQDGKDITANPVLTIADGKYPRVEVLFEKEVEKKTITIPEVENGTVALDGVNNGDEVAVGTEVAINVTPKDGYELESITVGGKDVTEAKKFTVGDDNTIVVKFRKITAIEGVDGVSVQVYPNPAIDYVQLRGFAPNTEVRLIALTGKTVLSTKTNFSGSATLNVSDLSRGLYLVRSGKIVVKLQVR